MVTKGKLCRILSKSKKILGKKTKKKYSRRKWLKSMRKSKYIEFGT
jgi:hypothetical protein